MTIGAVPLPAEPKGSPASAQGWDHRVLCDSGLVFEHCEDAAWKLGG